MKENGYGLVNTLAETVWKMLNTTCPSLSYSASTALIKRAKTRYRERLHTVLSDYMEYNLLLKKGYLKEKHWMYAIFMASAESLPLLYQQCTREEILQCILAKTSLGTSSKLLDNLNDEIHTPEEALTSLENYLSALKTGDFEKKWNTPVERVESAACEIVSWIHDSLDHDAPAFSFYTKDCTTLVEGQIMSLNHKTVGWPSLSMYVESIAEKSIGDVWIDIDLCRFNYVDETLVNLKKGNEYIFKSSLVYDDVQDIYEDIETKSVNSAVILGLEQGVISPDDLVTRDTEELVALLRESGVLKTIILLADALFLKGVDTVLPVESSRIDLKGLLQSFRLVRLFNLRKLLAMNKDFWTLKQVLASFGNFECLRDQIPDQMSRLVN